MRIIFESEYQFMQYDSGRKLIIATWIKSEKLTDDILKKHLLEYRDLVGKYKPKGVFIKNFNYGIIPQLQMWITKNIDNHTSQKSIEKVAFLVSSKYYAQLSLEQFVDESNIATPQLQNRFFDNEEEALKWFE